MESDAPLPLEHNSRTPFQGNMEYSVGSFTTNAHLLTSFSLYKKIAQCQTLHQQLQSVTPSLNGSSSYQDSILFRLANQIRNSLDLENILQTTVSEVQKLLRINYCHFLWYLPGGEQMNLIITHEAKTPGLPSFLGDLPSQQTGSLVDAILDLNLLRIDDVSTSSELSQQTRSLLTQWGMISNLLLPLKTQAGQFGAILCSHCEGVRTWSEHELELLQAVTDQVAIALDQAELLARTRATALSAQTQADYLSAALKKLQQTQAQLIQHEKMSSLGQLVAGVAHEINNPVNFISGNIPHATVYIQQLIELLQLYQEAYPEPTPEIQEKVEEMELEFLIKDLLKLLSSMTMGAERIRKIVLSLRNFSRLDESDIKFVDIHEGIDNTLLILKSRLKENNKGQEIRVVTEYGKLPLVKCYAGQLNQVFMNILSNAIDALEDTPNPTITIRTEAINNSHSIVLKEEETVGGSYVAIHIRDNGSGITEDIKEKLFNPFFTTKPVGKGTGLGLSISYQIVVEKHYGSLSVWSELEQGTEFLIQIPVKSSISPVQKSAKE
jgi:signal transduction histidine kinase